MQIYELNKNIVAEAGFLSKAYDIGRTAYDMAQKSARNYLAYKTGVHPEHFKGKPKEQPTVTPGPVPGIPADVNVPAYKRKGKQIAGINAPVAPPAAPAAPADAMSNMAGQLTVKPTVSSTGGITTPTSTGLTHTAKPAAPAPVAKAPAPVAKKTKTVARPKAVTKAKLTKVSAPPKPGAPTSAEYANLEKRLKQALAAKGRVK